MKGSALKSAGGCPSLEMFILGTKLIKKLYIYVTWCDENSSIWMTSFCFIEKWNIDVFLRFYSVSRFSFMSCSISWSYASPSGSVISLLTAIGSSSGLCSFMILSMWGMFSDIDKQTRLTYFLWSLWALLVKGPSRLYFSRSSCGSSPWKKCAAGKNFVQFSKTFRIQPWMLWPKLSYQHT